MPSPYTKSVSIQDWNDGRIPYYTLPPARNTDLNESAVVATWAQDFNADQVFANEASAVIAHLPSMDDDDRTFFQADTAGPAAVELAGMQVDSDSEEDGGAKQDTLWCGSNILVAGLSSYLSLVIMLS